MSPDLELSAWRLLHENHDLSSYLEHLFPLLRKELPSSLLMIRRLDPDRRRLETCATARAESTDPFLNGRTEFGGSDFQDLLNWTLTGQLIRGSTGAGGRWESRLPPPGARGTFIAGSLRVAERPEGIAMLLGTSDSIGRPDAAEIFGSLLGPLGAAFERDLREHDVSRLREAADADQRAELLPQDIAESIVGAETGLRGVMERVELVARTDAPVLIFGETGSGKEVVARAIHAGSRRATGPVLRVNCGAIPGELIDSELFGHERGSFTGAVGSRKGWFERADGGTLFLDEIGELSPAVQVRLLRILQDGTFERVGGQAPLSVDVRLIAATHRDLKTMVGRGEFREDLWYRISVFPIDLPPLRERREDIPMLAAHFAQRAGQRLGGGPLLPGAEDMELLLQYDWPGNVRELAAVIERAVILGNARRLELRAALGVATDPRVGPRSPGATIHGVTPAAFPTLDQAMRNHIEAALSAAGGRIEGPHGAARLLSINPHTLRARMRILGVEWRRFRKPRFPGPDPP